MDLRVTTAGSLNMCNIVKFQLNPNFPSCCHAAWVHLAEGSGKLLLIDLLLTLPFIFQSVPKFIHHSHLSLWIHNQRHCLPVCLSVTLGFRGGIIEEMAKITWRWWDNNQVLTGNDRGALEFQVLPVKCGVGEWVWRGGDCACGVFVAVCLLCFCRSETKTRQEDTLSAKTHAKLDSWCRRWSLAETHPRLWHCKKHHMCAECLPPCGQNTYCSVLYSQAGIFFL